MRHPHRMRTRHRLKRIRIIQAPPAPLELFTRSSTTKCSRSRLVSRCETVTDGIHLWIREARTCRGVQQVQQPIQQVQQPIQRSRLPPPRLAHARGRTTHRPSHFFLSSPPKKSTTARSSLSTSPSIATTSFSISFSSTTSSVPTVLPIISISASSSLTSLVSSLSAPLSTDWIPPATFDSTYTRSAAASSIFDSAARHELSVSVKSANLRPTFWSATSMSFAYFFGKTGSRV